MYQYELVKDFKCIKKLSNTNGDIFRQLVENYAPLLDKGNKINDTLYTEHDFSHHCVNIYKNISNILIQDFENALNHEELFILDVAVLFHDISMSIINRFDRNIHSEQSSDSFEKQYKTSILLQKLDKKQIYAIKLIIEAHSDLKKQYKDNKTGEIKIEIVKTLDNPELTNKMPGKIYDIKAKILAGILRLADELDITISRLGDYYIDRYLQLDNKNKNDETSIEHWKKLMCFKDVRLNEFDPRIVELVVDDTHVNKDKNKDEFKKDIKRIKEVAQKINKEIDNIDKHAFSKDPKSRKIIFIQSAIFVTNNNDIKVALDENSKKKLQ